MGVVRLSETRGRPPRSPAVAQGAVPHGGAKVFGIAYANVDENDLPSTDISVNVSRTRTRSLKGSPWCTIAACVVDPQIDVSQHALGSVRKSTTTTALWWCGNGRGKVWHTARVGNHERGATRPLALRVCTPRRSTDALQVQPPNYARSACFCRVLASASACWRTRCVATRARGGVKVDSTITLLW